MKKLKLLIPLVSISSLMSSFSLLSVSCTDYEKTKLLEHPDNKEGFNGLPLKEYSKVGKLLNQKVTQKAQSDEKDPQTGLPKLEEYTETYWDWFHSMEGEITKVVDGDTVYARITKLPKTIGNYSTTFKVGQIIKLRIPSIDTLEEHVPNKEVDPVEKAYALRDHAFAESLLPVGTKVRMVSPNWANKTYDRYLADLFFGENFERNFSTEMLAGGYTLPRLPWNGEYLASFRSNYNRKVKETYTDLILPYLAYAFNDGIAKKRGFYNWKNQELKQAGLKYFKNPYQFSANYKSHGTSLISESEGILSSKFSKYRKNEKNQLFRWIQHTNKLLQSNKLKWED